MKIEYKIENEKEFSDLALVGTKNGRKNCTFIDTGTYIDAISDDVTMVITTSELASQIRNMQVGICVVQEPRIVYFRVHNYLCKNEKAYVRKYEENKIASSAKISPMSSIASHNVVIGENVIIEEFVVIRENVVIGNDTIVRAGTIIGGQGYELKRNGRTMLDVYHAGGVIIENNVEIKHNVVIDKAVYSWDNTVVGEYSRLDNLVQLSHGVKIGKRVMIVATAAVFGRTVVKDGAKIGPNAVIRNAIEIGNNAVVSMGAVVTKDVQENEQVTGNFAVEHQTFLEQFKEQYRIL